MSARRDTSTRISALALLQDEAGGEVLEYALIAGLIVVAAVLAIFVIGHKIRARWTSVRDSM